MPISSDEFSEGCLRAHNDYRELHDAPALTLNADLSAMAQRWADHLAANDLFEHSPERPYKGYVGENLAMSWTSWGADYLGEQPTTSWYDEIQDYHFDRHVGTEGKMTGHFTQVVWKGSLELGVGRGKSKDGTWYAVANYYPGGNVIGHYEENVVPSNGDSLPKRCEEEVITKNTEYAIHTKETAACTCTLL